MIKFNHHFIILILILSLPEVGFPQANAHFTGKEKKLFQSTPLPPEVNATYQLPKENQVLKAIRVETDPAKLRNFEEKYTLECPFKKPNSTLASLASEARTLQLAANIPDSKVNDCQAKLKDFSDSIQKTEQLQTSINTTPNSLTPEGEAQVTMGLKNTQIAASTFNTLLQSGCELKNSSSDISSVGNQLINLLDTGATILAYTVPTAGLIAAGAAISGRLIVSLSKWLIENSKNQTLAKEATDSERFINDLCLFRNLAYKYDDLYIDPLENKDIERLTRTVLKNKATAIAVQARTCLKQPDLDSITKLEIFSKELQVATDGLISQKQCLNLLNKLSDGSIHLTKLVTNYGCPTPKPDASKDTFLFCKRWEAVEKLKDSDCELVSVREEVNIKFTSLSDSIGKSIVENSKLKTPVGDELQKLREDEKDERIATQRYASLEAIIEDSPMSLVNSSKSMTALGRTILGERFDDFNKATLKTADANLKDAKKNLNRFLNLKYKADKIKDPNKRAEKQQEVCTGAAQLRDQLSVAYNSSKGIKEICDFMKGSGVPPLKSKGFNFDNYSSANSNYISARCKKIEIEINENIMIIQDYKAKAAPIGCGF